MHQIHLLEKKVRVRKQKKKILEVTITTIKLIIF